MSYTVVFALGRLDTQVQARCWHKSCVRCCQRNRQALPNVGCLTCCPGSSARHTRLNKMSVGSNVVQVAQVFNDPEAAAWRRTAHIRVNKLGVVAQETEVFYDLKRLLEESGASVRLNKLGVAQDTEAVLRPEAGLPLEERPRREQVV